MSLDALTADAFRPRLNETFRLTGPGPALDLVLAEVTDAGQGANRRAFSLIFSAPSQPVKPQAIYRLDHPAMGALEIFLVPLGPEHGVFRYQAIFT
jgi:hypothetical protein